MFDDRFLRDVARYGKGEAVLCEKEMAREILDLRKANKRSMTL